VLTWGPGRSLRRRGRAGAAGAALALALLGTGAAWLASPDVAQAGGASCEPAGPATPAVPTPTATATPSPTVTATATVTATVTETPTSPAPPAVSCPAGGDLGLLLEGEEIVWTPVIVPDPRDEPGQPGQRAEVWTDGISDYTWQILRGSDQAVSTECDGQPVLDGECYPHARATYVLYRWDEEQSSWRGGGGSGSWNGCSRSGGRD
jgi:hypothetical protein